MDKKIKDAIHQTAKNIEMNPYLEAKTMDYIIQKSAQSRKKRLMLTRAFVGILSVSTIFIFTMLPKSKDEEARINPISDLSGEQYSIEPQQNTRVVEDDDVFASFVGTLTELGLSYDVNLKFRQSEVSIYTIRIENQENFFIKVNVNDLEETICLIVDELLLRYGESQDHMKQMKLDDHHYVLYQGNNQDIIKYLNKTSEEFSCE